MTGAIIIIREPMAYPPGRRGARWCYTYAIDGAPAVTYGSGLASLRDMLRRRYPSARLVETWRGGVEGA